MASNFKKEIMAIDANMVVSLNYKLTDSKTGNKIEETTTENPMLFLFGVGAVIPEFEDQLRNKNTGDTFDFTIASENAYGTRSEEQVVMMPIDIFHDEAGKLRENEIFVGALVPMADNEGNHLRGMVLEIKDELVKMDFNHPLAEMDLHFEGVVLEVRPATTEELEHGHAHGVHGHQH